MEVLFVDDLYGNPHFRITVGFPQLSLDLGKCRSLVIPESEPLTVGTANLHIYNL